MNEGKDAGALGAAERACLRRQALDWLRAELTACGKQLDGGKPEARALLLQALQRWQRPPDLAGVRGALAELPQGERQGWVQLWADVEHTLTKARARTSRTEKSDKEP